MSSIHNSREPNTIEVMPWDLFAEIPSSRLCGVCTKDGSRCRKLVVPGRGRCRSHGGAAGAPFGPRNGNWKTGAHSQAAKLLDRAESAELRRLYKLGKEIGLFPKRGRGRKLPAKAIT